MEKLPNFKIEQLLAWAGYKYLSKKDGGIHFSKGEFVSFLYLSSDGETKKIYLQEFNRSYDKNEFFELVSTDPEEDISSISLFDSTEVYILDQTILESYLPSISLGISHVSHASKYLEETFGPDVKDKICADFQSNIFSLEDALCFPLTYKGRICNYVLLNNDGYSYVNNMNNGIWNSKYFQGCKDSFICLNPKALVSVMAEKIPMDHFSVLLHSDFHDKTVEKMFVFLREKNLLPLKVVHGKDLAKENLSLIAYFCNAFNDRKTEVVYKPENGLLKLTFMSESKLDTPLINFVNGITNSIKEANQEAVLEVVKIRERKKMVLTFSDKIPCVNIAISGLIDYFQMQSLFELYYL